MDSIKLNRSVLTTIGVCAAHENTSIGKKILNNFMYYLIFTMTTINLIATTIFFLKYVSTDYAGSIYGFLASTALVCTLYTFFTLRYKNGALASIFSTLEDIYSECKKSFRFFVIHEQKYRGINVYSFRRAYRSIHRFHVRKPICKENFILLHHFLSAGIYVIVYFWSSINQSATMLLI